MIINSPVGRFPFQIAGATLEEGRIRIEGAMGTWPTSVEVEPGELPRLAWRLLGPRRATALGAATALAFAVGWGVRR